MIKRFTTQTPAIIAPDFELVDTQGNPVCLQDYRGKKSVVLVLARGFA